MKNFETTALEIEFILLDFRPNRMWPKTRPANKNNYRIP